MIGIVDAGLGNVRSIENMLRRIGAPAELVSEPERLNAADRVILPGVGAFDNGMSRLHDQGFTPVLNHLALERRIPVLGICLGMHLMTRGSAEGATAGLGWVDADTMAFDFDEATKQRLKVPHMGWNDISVVQPGALFANWAGDARFYFVHSYRVVCRNTTEIAAVCSHGTDFVAAFQRNNIMGVQFHPEKSHRYGMELLRRFANLKAAE